MTAAATTGPASGPLPASSQPAIGHTPRLSAERSRRKVGRWISSSSGRRTAPLPASLRLMRHDDHAAARSAMRTGAAVNYGDDLWRDLLCLRRAALSADADRENI